MARSPIHPGEHLREELDTLGMSAAELSRQLGVPTNRVTNILNGQRSITGLKGYGGRRVRTCQM